MKNVNNVNVNNLDNLDNVNVIEKEGIILDNLDNTKESDAVAILDNDDEAIKFLYSRQEEDFALFGGDESFFANESEIKRQDEAFEKANTILLITIEKFKKVLDNKRLSKSLKYSDYIKKIKVILKNFNNMYKKAVADSGDASEESLLLLSYKNKTKDLLDSFELNRSITKAINTKAVASVLQVK
jgi:hypothetical protein